MSIVTKYVNGLIIKSYVSDSSVEKGKYAEASERIGGSIGETVGAIAGAAGGGVASVVGAPIGGLIGKLEGAAVGNGLDSATSAYKKFKPTIDRVASSFTGPKTATLRAGSKSPTPKTPKVPKAPKVV